MEVDDTATLIPRKLRSKLNRLRVLVLIASFSLIMCFYYYIKLTPEGKPSSHQVQSLKISEVNILLQQSPNNVTVMPTTAEGAQVTSVKDLLGNSTDSPLTLTTSGEKNSAHTEEQDRRFKLTNFDEIKINIKNIFFIESRCGLDSEFQKRSPDDGVVFKARQVCAIESTASMNPNRPVYVLHTCPLGDNFYEKSPKYVQEMMSYPNVHLVQLNMSDLFIRTNVEELYFGGKFKESNYPVQHMSDVMRLLILWKFGGTYMDIDLVSMRSIDDLGVNFAGWQDDQTVNNGVMNFDVTGFGHTFLTRCLDALKGGYDPQNWSTNGPILITRLLSEMCNIFNQTSKCKEFTAYPIPFFYPIYYPSWGLFFEEKNSNNTLNQLKETYVVHIWNQMSKDAVVNVGSQQPYALLADKYCPKTYHNCGKTF